MTRHRWLNILPRFLVVPLLLLGCNRTSQTPQETPRMRVLAVVVPLADLARQVGGRYVTVDAICEAGRDPRDVQVTDDLRRRIVDAQFLVTSGYGESWTSGGMGNLAEADRIIRPELTPTGKVRPMATADLWLDPTVAREVIEVIRDRLTARDPGHKDEFRDNAVKAIQRLEELDARLRKDLAPLKGRRFMSLRPSWGAFADRYGLEEVAPVDARPENLSDDDARKIRTAAKKAGTEYLVIDASLISGVRHQLESQTGLKLLPLDRLGSSVPDARNTYDKIMEYNRKELVEGLK